MTPRLFRSLGALLLVFVLVSCIIPTFSPTPQQPTRPPTFTPSSSPRAGVSPSAPSPTPLPYEEAPNGFPSIIRQKWFGATRAWAVSGETNPQLVRTQDGGLTWYDVMPLPYLHIDDASEDLFFLNPDAAWLLSRVGGSLVSGGTLYRTTDGGASWQSSRTPFSTALLTFFDLQNGIAAVTKGCADGCLVVIYRTSDGGETWSVDPDVRSPSGEGGLPEGTLHLSARDILFQDEKIFWIYGTQDGVNPSGSLMVSRDGARTWSEKALPEGFNLPAALPVFLDKEFGFTYTRTYEGITGILLTRDGGETWKAASLPRPGEPAGLLLQFATAQDGFIQDGKVLYSTQNGGQTWQEVPSNLAFDAQHNLFSFEFTDSKTGRALVNNPEISGMSYYALYQTGDGGRTWKLQPARLLARVIPTRTPLPDAPVENLLTQTPTPAPTVVVTPSGPISLSWVHYMDRLHAYAITDASSQLLKTDDSGLTWQDISPLPSGNDIPNIVDSRWIWIAIRPAEGTLNTEPDADKDTIYRSNDAGATWKKIQAPFSWGSIEMLDEHNGWATASQGCGAGSCWVQLYITQDGGETWTQVKTSLPGEIVLGEGSIHLTSGQGFVFQSLDTLWMGGGFIDYGPPVLLVSHDRGLTWEGIDIQLPDNLRLVHMETPAFLNAKDGFLSLIVEPVVSPSPQDSPPQSLVVFVTSDGGKTWLPRPVFRGGGWRIQPQFITPTDWFMSCGTQLCRTMDGGQTWQALDFPPGGGSTYYTFGFSTPLEGWALVSYPLNEREEDRCLYLTHNGGDSWESIKPINMRP